MTSYINILFRFVDADGDEIIGVAKRVRAAFDEIQKSPTVVYERGNSLNHFLFRPSTVTLVPD